MATTSRASADAAAAAFGVHAAYDDPRALITASDIDIVSVCVRVPYHRDLVLAAHAAEKHVYCEWPLGRDRAEATEMAAAARARAVHVAIGLQAHMNPAARRAAELITARRDRPTVDRPDLFQHRRFRAAPTGDIHLSQQD